MFHVRVHGRGSDEVAGTARLLSSAALIGGRAARVVTGPASGAGPVHTAIAAAHCVIDGRQSGAPGLMADVDGLIVQDPAVLRQADVFDGIRPETYVLVNSAHGFGDLGLSKRLAGQCRDRLMILPVTGLKVVQQDGCLLSAMMVGGFAALCGIVDLPAVVAAIQGSSTRPVAGGACAAASAAHDFVLAEREGLVAV
jgi:pyruvate ferredoxin oxidoreductase gamma subunit